MENASKALLMAAGVLIGILILSLTVYLFTSFATTSAEVHEENRRKQIDQFNSQFTSYVGNEDITIYQIITMANLASENNIYYEFAKRNYQTEGKDYYISVRWKNEWIEGGYNNTTTELTKRYNQYIATELGAMKEQAGKEETELQLKKYNCQVQISPTTGRVYLVTLTEKR